MSVIQRLLNLPLEILPNMFSKACEYGIKASIYIAGQSKLGRKVGLKEVAKSIESPEAYTSKILQLLSKNNLLLSEKGPTGGFFMDGVQLETVTLGNLVTAIDGDNIYKGCGLGLKQCNEIKPCPLHKQFKHVREELQNMLEGTSVANLSSELSLGLTFLKT